MIVVDASVLIGHLSARDDHHAAATDLLLATAQEVLVVHPITLAEVLVGGARVGRGHEMLTDLTSVGITLAARDDGEALRLAELRVMSGLKLPDCCVLDVALTHAARIATFDRALAAAARQLGLSTVT